MAQLFSSVLGGIADSLLRNLSEGTPSNKVVEVKSDDYARQPVIDREDCLTLYGPHRELYDVILQIPFRSSTRTAYSLFRSKDIVESQNRFAVFKEIIPLLLDCSQELCNRHSMQSVCDLLQEHPAWTITHVAAHLGVTECLSNSLVQQKINCVCNLTGQTPLHVAVATEHIKVVQAFLDAGAQVDLIDGEGNTVYHAAANTTREIIQLLAGKSVAVINHRNNMWQTPLHIACHADKPECVKALIYAGADVNATGTANEMSGGDTPTSGSARDVIEMYPRQFHAKDMKYGGTPLHWAMSGEVVEALVELGCTVDARDFKGDTALHTMVLRSRLQCIIAILCYNADANACNENLDTPLHLAVKTGSLSIVQALIVFGANIDCLNKAGDSPRHIVATMKPKNHANILNALHCVGARRCDYDKNGCNEGCQLEGKYDGVAMKPANEPRTRHFFDDMIAASAIVASLSRRRRGIDEVDSTISSQESRVLCLDGGGIRGLILIQMLITIEETLKIPIGKSFNWICGTSTGGILALLLATGRSARYCQCVYFRLKNKVFNGLRPYDSKPLESFLQKELGEHTVMSDIKEPKVVVTGVLADRHPAELHLFRNYTSPQNLLGCEMESQQFHSPPAPEDQLMWRAARASGAAPTYFRAMGRFVDGGLIANNPTLDIMTEIHEYNCALKATGQDMKVQPLSCIVSLGTGKPPITPVKAIDVFCPESAWDAAKMAFGMSALGHLLIDQSTSTEGRVISRARAWSSMIGVPYFRFNPDISEDVALDETKDEILVKMLWETAAFMHSKRKELEEIKDLL